MVTKLKMSAQKGCLQTKAILPLANRVLFLTKMRLDCIKKRRFTVVEQSSSGSILVMKKQLKTQI